MKQELKIMDPMVKAWERTIDYCFVPFNFSKWVVMGFVTWIVFLWEGGGQDFNYNQNIKGNDFCKIMVTAKEGVVTFWNEYFGWCLFIIASLVILFIAGIVIGIVVSWLKGRFEFIFLDNVLKNKYEVASPWTQFKSLGNSLFKWKVYFGIPAVLLIWLIRISAVVLTLFMCWTSIEARALHPAGVKGLILGGSIFLFSFLLSLIVVILDFVVRNFLVPVMYNNNILIRESWGKFLAMFKSNIGAVVLFTLTFFGFSIVGVCIVLMVIIIVMVVTCFIFCFISLIPIAGQMITAYVIAVAVLPVTVFFRYFSYEYIDQVKFPETGIQKEFDPKEVE